MVDDQRQGRAGRDPGEERRIEREADVLHGRELLVGVPSPLEHARDARGGAHLEPDMPVDAHQPLELVAHPARVVDRDEKRARQLRGTGEKLVVDRQLFPHPLEVCDPLHPEHLLHLIPDRRAILEEERHAVTHRYPPRLLVGDDAATNRVATARIALAAEDILERDWPHHAVESSVRPSYAASRASTGW